LKETEKIIFRLAGYAKSPAVLLCLTSKAYDEMLLDYHEVININIIYL
jgi:hypothetical protein